MSLAQLASNVAYALGVGSRAPFTWPDSSPSGSGKKEAVLGRVYVGPTLPPNWQRDAVVPFALVRPGAVKWNREHPEAVVDEAKVTVGLLVANANDQAGGAALVGALRSGQGSSVGKGLLDVEAAVIARLNATVNQGNGLPLGARPSADTSAEPIVPQGYEGVVVARAVETLTVKVPTQPVFAQVQQLLGVKNGSAADLTWQQLPDSYDLVGVLVCRSSGLTPPATPSGSGITQVATLPWNASGYNNTGLSSGTYSYSVFGAFDTTRDPYTGMSVAAPDRYSGYVLATAGLAPSFVYAPASCTVVI